MDAKQKSSVVAIDAGEEEGSSVPVFLLNRTNPPGILISLLSTLIY